MIANYIKLAIRVLSRRKFFTFISLFGISFTLMILMIMISFLQAELGNDGPKKYTDRLVYIPMVKIEKQFYDTITVYDTTYVDGLMQIDSTKETKSRGRRLSISEGSRSIFENHIPKVKTAEKYSIYHADALYNTYVNNSKIQVNCVYADAPFWEIYPFDFLEGRPFTHAEWENSSRVAVISTEMAMEYFGVDRSVLGKQIELDGKTFEVIGLIQTKTGIQSQFGGKVYIPYTNLEPSSSENYYHGGFHAALLTKSGISIQDMKDDIKVMADQIPIKDPEEYNELFMTPYTTAERFSSQIYWDEDPSVSYKVISTVIISLLLLFILLPTLNLINLNVSRIMDRSSEIGVRKAFGADQKNILFQFIFENIVLTLLGGIIGLIMALVLIKILNDSKILEIITLTINWKFFFYSFVICIFFGILSGFLPAYKMSKLHIANAIKQRQL